VDYRNATIREVEGVLGVAEPMADSGEEASSAPVPALDFEARAVPLIMAAIGQVPKELARVIAQYARPGGHTRTIAGKVGASGYLDGPALGAKLDHPICVALDTTDVVAGPQLWIGQLNGLLRCLDMRTQMVSTVVGAQRTAEGHGVDGPASSANILTVRVVVVAPNGALLIADQNSAIRRVSAIKRTASGAERMVTTLIGAAGFDVKFSASTAESFKQVLDHP
jgi:hypothetical protein